MHNLNLKHLRYFWAVADHGTIAKAAKILHLTPQTISGQLRELESQVGDKLFAKSGRNLVLTDTGRMVFSYAEEMFRLSSELQDVLSGRLPGGGASLKVGVADVVPKLVAYRVLSPVLKMEEPTRLIVTESSLVDLLAELSVHKLDLVLADAPISPSLNIRAFNHSLGESGTTFFASESLLKQHSGTFPGILDGAPILMPTRNSALRNAIDIWLEKKRLRPTIVAEFEDRALMKTFGEDSAGIFPSPTAVEGDVVRKYGVKVVGRTEEIREQYYAITPERRIRHPAVTLITEKARSQVFG